MKQLIFALIFTFCSLYSFAQEFYGGILAGFNGSQVEGDVTSGYNKMGLVGGAWIQRNINQNFYWGMELKVNQKGSRIMPTTKNGNWKYVYRLNYIDLPVLLGYNFKSYLSVFGGLSYGYVFNKNGYSSYGLEPTVKYDNTSKWEMGGFLGLKVDFDRLIDRRWTKNIQLETRIQYSMLSIDESHTFILMTNYNRRPQYNNVISTVLYYRIESKRYN